MKIKIYAPVNCSVKKIENSSDNSFAKKLLGNGILLFPKNELFCSPFETSTCTMVFDTKHAYGFKVKGCEFLIHVGIDTVNLQGKPFTTKMEVNQQINLGEKMFSVDLKLIKANKLSIETPIICVDNNKQVNIENFEEGEYKQGELICTFNIKDKKQVIDINQAISFESKYTKTANDFVKFVGGETNYTDVYNCMTRLRFKIRNKSLVDTASIEKNSLVKGINWNGSELQVIIGGECYKVKDEILKQKIKVSAPSEESIEQTHKPTVSQKIFAGIAGIMAPNIPILMSAGIFAALYSIFNQTGVTVDLSSGDNTINADMFSIIMFVLSKTGILLVGVFFCYNTIKYFGGEPLLGLVIGLILTSRFFMGTGLESNAIIDPEQYRFGKFIIDGQYGARGWYLFSLADYPIVIKSYEGSVLPFLVAGVIACYLDRWVKKWMPASIDIVFRAALVILLTIVPIIFVLGPFLSLIEFGMTLVINGLGYIPLGIGVGIFAMFWQPLVLTGVHVGVYMTLLIPLLQGEASIFLPALQIAVFAQVGAGIAVALLTKNPLEKRVAWGSIPGGIFGITEPIIYSTNLPKVKPFLVGCFASLIGGTISGIIGIQQVNPGAAQGILYTLAIVGLKNQLLFLLILIITVAVSIGVMFLTYNQKIDQIKFANKLGKKIALFVNKTNTESQQQEKIKAYLEKINLVFKAEKETYTKYEKYLQEIIKHENDLIKLENKEEVVKTKLHTRIVKLQKKPKANQDKLEKLILLFKHYNLDEQKNTIEINKQNYIALNIQLVKTYQDSKKNIAAKIEEFNQAIKQINEICELANYAILYDNALNTIEIGYGYQDKTVYRLSKEFKNKIKTKEKQHEIC